MSAPPGRAGREGPRVPSPAWRGLGAPAAASGDLSGGESVTRRLRGRSGAQGEGGTPPASSDRLGGPFGPRAPPEHPAHCSWSPVPFPPPAGPPTTRCKWAGGRAGGGAAGDLIAVTRDSSQGPAGAHPQSPSSLRGPPRAPLRCRDWGGAALFPAAGTISGSPFPGGCTSARLSRKEGPLPTVALVRSRGLDLCRDSACPAGLRPPSRPKGRLRSVGLPHRPHRLSARAAARLFGGGRSRAGLAPRPRVGCREEEAVGS